MRSLYRNAPGQIRRVLAWTIGIALLPVAGLSAEVLTLETVGRLAVSVNHEVQLLERSLRDQLQDLGIKGYLDEIVLLASGSVVGDEDTDSESSGSATLSGSLEVLPQLIIDAQVTASDTTVETPGIEPDRVTASFGLTLIPLADTTRRRRERLAAERTAADLMSAMNAARFSAVVSLLDAVTAFDEQPILTRRHEVAEQSLANVSALHERDRATDDQLRAAQVRVRAGVEELIRAELRVERAVEVLARQIGVAPGDVEISSAEALNLDEVVADAERLIQSTSAAALAAIDPSVQKAEFDVVAAQLDVDSARRFSPRISVTATGGLPDRSYDLGAEISLSSADWDGLARSDAESDLEYAANQHAYSMRLAVYDAHAALNELQFALDAVSYTSEQVEDAQLDLAEAEIRLGRGGITGLERDEAALALVEAESDASNAIINVARQFFAIQNAAYQ